VTMLQRSPCYVLAIPSRDAVAALAHRVLPARAATAAVRWKNMLLSAAGYAVTRRLPRPTGSLLRRRVAAALPPGYPVDPHFTPAYDPWDQRMCLAPDGDLFAAIRAGRVEVVTDRIARLTRDGVALASGRRLDADLVVTATGLRLLPLGGIALTVDGRAVDLPSTVAYKGMMLSGVPNLAFVFGYAHASWTLKSDLVSEYVCRLLDHLDARGHDICTPLEPPTPEREPLIDLRSGYVLRGLADLPRQGTRYPWRLHQSYLRDARLLRRAPVEDEGVRFERACGRTPAAGDGAAVP
jgi:monooxygenase